MQKQDIDLLFKFWVEIEKNMYHKAHHLRGHYLKWVSEHGPIYSDSPHAHALERMLDAADLHKECDDE